MKTILYGEDLVWGNSVVVLEGPLDAIAVGPGAVATLGLGVTPDQLARIARYPMRTICFDAEPSAQRRARAVAASLAPYPGITRVIAIESGKDAAEADPAELAEIRHSFLSL